MTARVLVVDDIPANVKLLEARLSAEYFEVLTASSGQAALDICARERIDVILLDVMMPGMDGFETCQRLKSDLRTHHVPVVMVTALDQPSDRLLGLENGADDFLTKPVDEVALITRVKNLARLKMLNDEMLMRASTGRDLGIEHAAELQQILAGRSGRILIVDDHKRSATRTTEALSTIHEVSVEGDPQVALEMLNLQDFDLAIVSLRLNGGDGLRLCSQVRSLDRTRHMSLIVVIDPGDEARLMRALDMGVNDYVMRPLDPQELQARVRTQIRRKRHSDYLRNTLKQSVEALITDPLTGLHNRRYMESHLKTLVANCLKNGRALSVMIADIDHFKQVNDTWGHDAGDTVLREFAARLRRNTRGMDMSCRLGGEEFLVIMPDTDINHAYRVAERLRTFIAADGFTVSRTDSIRVTASVGIATLETSEDTPEAVIKRADDALYAAKRRGRNHVSPRAA